MADNKDEKFWWIKLKTDFFSEDSPIDFLLSQPNGSEYVVLYIKLCLATANTKGGFYTEFGEIIVPYDVEKIARDMKHFSVDTVRIALEIYKKLGLVYQEERGILRITDHENMVGCETKWAQKKRDYRASLKGQNEGQIEGLLEDNVRQEIRDKSIEIRDKNIEKRNKKIEIKYYPTDEILNSAFSDYVEMRKKIKAPMTEKAIELAISKLEKLSNGDNDKAVEILEQSIMNSWKGLFPIGGVKQEKARKPYENPDGTIDWSKV